MAWMPPAAPAGGVDRRAAQAAACAATSASGKDRWPARQNRARFGYSSCALAGRTTRALALVRCAPPGAPALASHGGVTTRAAGRRRRPPLQHRDAPCQWVAHEVLDNDAVDPQDCPECAWRGIRRQADARPAPLERSQLDRAHKAAPPLPQESVNPAQARGNLSFPRAGPRDFGVGVNRGSGRA